jgi:hypothetical protein
VTRGAALLRVAGDRTDLLHLVWSWSLVAVMTVVHGGRGSEIATYTLSTEPPPPRVVNNKEESFARFHCSIAYPDLACLRTATFRFFQATEAKSCDNRRIRSAIIHQWPHRRISKCINESINLQGSESDACSFAALALD